MGGAVGVGDGFGAGSAITVPLFHTNFLPLLIHVNFLPALTAVLPTFVQAPPGCGLEAAVAGMATKDSSSNKTGRPRFTL